MGSFNLRQSYLPESVISKLTNWVENKWLWITHFPPDYLAQKQKYYVTSQTGYYCI